MADNNIFFVNGVETSSAADVQTALDQATSGISISVWNGDIAFIPLLELSISMLVEPVTALMKVAQQRTGVRSFSRITL